MINKAKIDGYLDWCNARAARNSKPPYLGCYAIQGDMQETYDICNWLDLNLFQERHLKQPQLWLWSYAPNKGKSTFSVALQTRVATYCLPKEDDYLTTFECKLFDLIICDDFKGEIPIQRLNSFVDGTPCPYKRKYATGLKLRNLPVIFIGNNSIRNAYPTASSHEVNTLQSRFIEVELMTPFKIEFIEADVLSEEDEVENAPDIHVVHDMNTME